MEYISSCWDMRINFLGFCRCGERSSLVLQKKKICKESGNGLEERYSEMGSVLTITGYRYVPHGARDT